MKETFDEEYFERGYVAGKSCYTNYRWLPELTIPLAYHLINHLGLKDHHRLLDFGCAKGYLVRAFRLLGFNAFGCDCSHYAESTWEGDLKECCCRIGSGMFPDTEPFNDQFDWVITMDVLEHLDKEQLGLMLSSMARRCDAALHVIPLGDASGQYIIPYSKLDSTHQPSRTWEQWYQIFQDTGWEVERVAHQLRGIKEGWTKQYESGYGFFFLRG